MGKIEKLFKPQPLLPFELYDISDFVVKEHKNINPLINYGEYERYWYEQVDYCLMGKWGYDYDKKRGLGGYRWIPGNLYFYVNMSEIKMGEDEGREVYARPFLRDIEWKIFYALIEADGFSGFTDDKEYTSYLPVGKLQGKVRDNKGNIITKLKNYEEIRLKRYKDFLVKPNGEYKEYLPPQELLYRTYKEPKGKALYFNEMKNLIILSTRGCGKSYSISNGVVEYDFTFGSARNAKEFFSAKYPSVVVVGSALSTKSASLLKKFQNSYEYLRTNIGAYKDEEININGVMYQPYEGSLRAGKSITNRIQEKGGRAWIGTGNEIWHVSYKDNASAGVGERARRMVVEEAGLLSNFLEVHAENTGSQKREVKTGYTVYIGTGGNVEKIKGIREAFYNPLGFDAVGFKDVYSNKPGQIGLFIPAYYRSNDYKDENGNTDYVKAFEDEMMIREEKRKSGSKAYEGYAISYPIVPAEMFLQSSGNIFPTDKLESRLTDLETGLWEKLAKPGELVYVNKERTKVTWIPKSLENVSVIKRWGDEKNMTEEELKGTIIIYEHPVENRPSLKYVDYLYVVTYDSVKDDEGGTSLACVQVWKFWDFENPEKVQFNLVAEWLGRHIGMDGLEKDHDIAFKLASYYNAPILPEINLKDIIRYGRMSRRYYYFLPRPEMALSGMQIKQKKEYAVGVYISPGMKPDLEKYLFDALHTVVNFDHEINEEEEVYNEVKMVDLIPSMRLIEELLYYNRDENFDSVSAAFLFGMVKRERENESIKKREEELMKEEDEKYLRFLEDNEKYNESFINPAFNY